MTALISVQFIDSKTKFEDALELRRLGKHRGKPVALEVGSIIRPFHRHPKRKGDCVHFVVDNTKAHGKAWVRRGTSIDNEDNKPFEITSIKHLATARVVFTSATKTVVAVLDGDQRDKIYKMPPHLTAQIDDNVGVIFDDNKLKPHWADMAVIDR